ncbi:hypothetical protein HYV84_08110 [Candidatus Woesearchaeota archaeon]|nr:hypothetical protein [Candidatus Woesearchaeota archaeon]
MKKTLKDLDRVEKKAGKKWIFFVHFYGLDYAGFFWKKLNKTKEKSERKWIEIELMKAYYGGSFWIGKARNCRNIAENLLEFSCFIDVF